MAFNLSSGYGAGAGADMLQQILKQKALEFAQAEQARIADERTAQEGQRLKADSEWRRIQQQDRDDALKSRQAELDANRAEKVASAEKEGTLGKLRSAYIGSQNLAGTSDPSGAPATRGALRVAMASGGAKMNEIPQEPVAPKATKSPALQEYEDAKSQGYKGTFSQYQDEDANRKRQAAGGSGGGTPYFTYQPTYDATGQPIGAIRFDARGGPPVRVGVQEMGGLLKPPSAKIVNAIIDNEVTTKQMDRLNAMFEGDDKTPGAKNFVGPAAGRWELLKQDLPDMGIRGMDTKKVFTDFSAQTAALKNTFVKAITGAAVQENEAKRIMAQIPLETDRAEVWRSKMDQSRQNMQDLIRIIEEKARKAAGGGGTGGGVAAPPSGAPAPPRQGIRYDMNGKKIEG
jgi:hypothetical protein